MTSSVKKIVLGITICCVIVGGVMAVHAMRKPHRRAKAADGPPAQKLKTIADRPLGWTGDALFTAAYNGDLASLKQVIDQHPDLVSEHVGGYGGATPLHVAAGRGHADCVEELLRHNADVNARTWDGRTPLYDCINGAGVLEIGAMLLDHNASATIANNAGKTPLQLANDKNRSDLIKLLRDHGAEK
jgi:uncharacterized protein